MEQPFPISHDHESDSDSSKSSSSSGSDDGDVNHSSVNELVPDQSHDLNESPPHEEGTSDNGAEADRESTEEALDKIKRQDTHDLYCPNCTCNITKTAKLFKKGEETYPYNTQPLVLWVPLVIPFKLPSISLPWFHNTPADPAETTPLSNPSPNLPEQPRKFHFPNSLPWLSSNPLRFILGLVLILLSAILLWSPPNPLPPSQPNLFGPSPPNPFDPSPPNPVQASSQTPCDLILLYVSGVKYFLSVNYISVIALLFLAILVVFWPSIIVAWDKRNDKNPQNPIKDKETNDPKPHPSPYQDLWERFVPKNLGLLIRDLDILKSIVYGGLIESITSLGVVSSAAASGASTLNVLALGLANLFSGLFLIIHNLYGLITFQPRIQTANNDHLPTEIDQDPYENLLGNRKNKNLHCVIVVVSFIFFGVIPPLFYGLSFRRTDKIQYKAAVVLAASMVCIISLSFAKAYVFKMRKLKTVVEYTGMAIGGSALSFVVSQFVSEMLEKYDFHELGSDYREG